jgi:hypothetical protein
MPEGNGSGRLDRIEALLESIIEHHEREMKQLLTWQVLMQDKMDRWHDYMRAQERMVEAEREARKEADKALDARMDKLVSAIMQLVDRLPKGGHQ